MAKKPVITAKEAAAMIPDGATIMCGGFLACGQARAIVKELVARGTKDLTLIANDMARAVGPKGEEFFGIAELIHNHQVKRVIATHVGMTPEVGQQNTEGTLEVNLLPQGTLAECIRAGGAGLGGVLTPVGVDTLVEDSPFCLGPSDHRRQGLSADEAHPRRLRPAGHLQVRRVRQLLVQGYHAELQRGHGYRR